MNDSVAIIIHGYTLLAKDKRKNFGQRDWKHLVWGDSESQMLGRLTKGILLALKHHAKLLVFGTGSSCMLEGNPITHKSWVSFGEPMNIVWESEFIYNYMIKHFNDLNNFEEIKKVVSAFGGEEKAKEYIKKIAIKDIKSRNTYEEVHNALMLCNNKNIKTLISVSNLSHLPRCVAIALKEIKNKSYENYFLPSPCDTDFSSTCEVLIFEPQSGPGPEQSLHPCNIFKEYFYLSNELKYKFLIKCKKFLDTN